MKDELSVTYVGIDVSKDKLAVAVADGAPGGVNGGAKSCHRAA